MHSVILGLTNLAGHLVRHGFLTMHPSLALTLSFGANSDISVSWKMPMSDHKPNLHGPFNHTRPPVKMQRQTSCFKPAFYLHLWRTNISLLHGIWKFVPLRSMRQSLPLSSLPLFPMQSASNRKTIRMTKWWEWCNRKSLAPCDSNWTTVHMKSRHVNKAVMHHCALPETAVTATSEQLETCLQAAPHQIFKSVPHWEKHEHTHKKITKRSVFWRSRSCFVGGSRPNLCGSSQHIIHVGNLSLVLFCVFSTGMSAIVIVLKFQKIKWCKTSVLSGVGVKMTSTRVCPSVTAKTDRLVVSLCLKLFLEPAMVLEHSPDTWCDNFGIVFSSSSDFVLCS